MTRQQRQGLVSVVLATLAVTGMVLGLHAYGAARHQSFESEVRTSYETKEGAAMRSKRLEQKIDGVQKTVERIESKLDR